MVELEFEAIWKQLTEEMQRTGQTFEAVAEDVAPEEREALWATVVKINKHQGEYLDKVAREIPLVWFRRLQNS